MTTIHPSAAAAIRAARCWHIWGAYAARRYTEKHGAANLLTLARLLENAKRAGL